METGRRPALARILAAIGLVSSYGLLGGYAIAFLFPPAVRRRAGKVFIGRRGDFAPGSARSFVDQKGRTLIVLATADELSAFDARCPHLGCKAHWEAQADRFFCPCHGGAFDRHGVAFAGPPAAAKQSLTRVDLEVDARSGTVFLVSEI